MEEIAAARRRRVVEAKNLSRELGTSGSFAILVRGVESRADPRSGEPRAVWFSEYELLDAHIRILRHSPAAQTQEWQTYLYADVWAAADSSLAGVLGIIKEQDGDELFFEMLTNSSRIRELVERGLMGVGKPHSGSKNRPPGG